MESSDECVFEEQVKEPRRDQQRGVATTLSLSHCKSSNQELGEEDQVIKHNLR